MLMHPSRWPLVRHVHWLYLACRWEWWYGRVGKHHSNLPLTYVERYLAQVWEGRPHG